MKAAVICSPGNIQLKEVPDPITGDYDVLCISLAAAVCSGTDHHILENHPYFKVSFPTIPGHEGIGKVIFRGQRVRHFKEGDMISRVMNRLPDNCGYALAYGAFAEKTIATDWLSMQEDGIPEVKWAKYTAQRVLPADMDPVGATMIITFRETHSFFFRMAPEPGQSMLILGSGATARAFTDHARNFGVLPVVVGSPFRRSMFLSAGVPDFISYLETNPSLLLKKSGFLNFDIILDTVGKSSYLSQVISLLKPGGKLGVYGLDQFMEYSVTLTRAPGDFAYFNGEIYDEGSSHNAVMADLKAKRLNPWDYISPDHVYPFKKIKEAFLAPKYRKTLKSVVDFRKLP